MSIVDNILASKTHHEAAELARSAVGKGLISASQALKLTEDVYRSTSVRDYLHPDYNLVDSTIAPGASSGGFTGVVIRIGEK